MIEYKQIKEKLYHNSDNIDIFYIPNKKDEFFASLTINMGAVDNNFVDGDKKINVPDGMAHFLEHKVFEQKNGNALDFFGKTGASPNAFTSNNITSYYFSSVDKFYENLEILLKFVYNPYFTDENVQKEQGIIAQEIAMINDNPNWQVYTRLFDAMYHHHPIKNNVAGTKDSISVITKDLLYSAHKTFYNPKNMVLCISGDIDFEKAISIAQKLVPKESISPNKKHCLDEPKHVKAENISMQMDVKIPLFMIGIKDYDTQNTLAYEILVDVAINALFSPASDVSSNLYESGIINTDLENGYSSFIGGGTILIAASSKFPGKCLNKIKNEIENVIKNGIDDLAFERAIKYSFSEKVKTLDDLSEICTQQAKAHFMGNNYFDFQDIYKNINKKDIENYWKKFDVSKHISMSVIEGI